VRTYAEGWTLDQLLELTRSAVNFAVKEGMPVMFATEDTTRSSPETIRALFTTAIQNGASALGIADTVGHATPNGARSLVKFVREIALEQGEEIRIDWHGHQDRGLGVINSIAAIEGGANRVHGTALGIGERVGNAPMDQLLVNLKLMGWVENDLSLLGQYCSTAAAACGLTIPCNYPVFGRDAFRTASGIHAAALIKMSGKSNVIYWLETHGIEVTEERVSCLFEYAKRSSSVLEEDEAMNLIQETRGPWPDARASGSFSTSTSAI
jgi:2-isopropylmalate synthase